MANKPLKIYLSGSSPAHRKGIEDLCHSAGFKTIQSGDDTFSEILYAVEQCSVLVVARTEKNVDEATAFKIGVGTARLKTIIILNLSGFSSEMWKSFYEIKSYGELLSALKALTK